MLISDVLHNDLIFYVNLYPETNTLQLTTYYSIDNILCAIHPCKHLLFYNWFLLCFHDVLNQ